MAEVTVERDEAGRRWEMSIALVGESSPAVFVIPDEVRQSWVRLGQYFRMVSDTLISFQD